MGERVRSRWSVSVDVVMEMHMVRISPDRGREGCAVLLLRREVERNVVKLVALSPPAELR